MAIEKRYNLNGSCIHLASIRQQELVDSRVRRALFFKTDLIKVKTNDWEIDQSKAISLIQTSPGCFQLEFDCRKYNLTQSSKQFSVSVFYDNKIRKTYDIILKYPKQRASFIALPRIKNINWGKQVLCGYLEIRSSSDNIGSEWWQYEKRECVYIVYSDNIAVDGSKIVDFAGRKCLKIDIPKPLGNFSIPIKYIGKGRSHEGEESITLSYFINNQWANSTFSVRGSSPSFNLSLHRILSSVKSNNRVDIFKLIVCPTDNTAPEIKGLRVKANNDIVSLKKSLENEWEYIISLECGNINFYPINIETTISVESTNAGTKKVSFEIVSTRAKGDHQVEFKLDELFNCDLKTSASTTDEILAGIEFKMRNKSNLNLNNVLITLMSNVGVSFNNSSSLRFDILAPNQIIREKIKCAQPISKIFKAGISISITNSDFKQIIPLNIPILQKRINYPKITHKKLWDNSMTFTGNEMLFECIVENALKQSDSIREIEDLLLSDIRCSSAFELIWNTSNASIAPGKSASFSVRLKDCQQRDGKQEFILYFKNRVVDKLDVYFYHPTFRTKGKPIGKSFKYPQANFGPIPVAKILIEEINPVQENQFHGLIIKLDPLAKRYKISSEGFFANNQSVIFSEDQGNQTIYLDPGKFCDPNKLNIPEPIDCACEFIISDVDGSETKRTVNFIITPLEVLPVVEYQLNDTIIPLGEHFTAHNLEVNFAASKIKEGRVQDFASIIVRNVQHIPYPLRECILKAEISKQYISCVANGATTPIPCDIFSLSTDNVILENGEEGKIVFSIDLGKYKNLKDQTPNISMLFRIDFTLEAIEGELSNITLKGKLREEVFGEWYALDLGTTGIVLAQKNINGEIKPVPINNDHDKNSIPLLETDANIISSIMGIHSIDEDGNHEIKLEKDRDSVEFSELILPAAKFIVGQKEVPYLHRLEKVAAIKLFDKEGFGKVTPDLLISELYHHILGLISAQEVKRLTLTYPNTYTGDQVRHIKALISEKYPHLHSYVNAVPESDAVLAHYLTLRTNPGSPKKFTSDKENIVIYDMGAGTLDISYVEFRFDSKEHKGTASIVKKIGIPVAGNYLNLVIFKALKESLSSNNRQWDAKKRKGVIEDLKSSENILSTQILPYSFKDGKKGMSGEDIINSPFMSTYLEFCCERVFEVLFSTKDWKTKINTFVFSGRASRFVPLRKRIEEELNTTENLQIVDSLTISGADLKKSVAIGAIEYTNSYSSEDGQHRFKIESRSQYHKIYCIYQTYGDFANRIVKCVKLIDPDTAEWDKVPVVNGTKSMKLAGEESIDLHPESTKITLVQTLLNPEDLEKLYTKLWFPNESLGIIDDDCFINEILSIPVSELGKEWNSVLISLNLDEDNNMDLKINNSRYLGEKVRESVESNRYYNVNFTLESE